MCLHVSDHSLTRSWPVVDCVCLATVDYGSHDTAKSAKDVTILMSKLEKEELRGKLKKSLAWTFSVDASSDRASQRLLLFLLQQLLHCCHRCVSAPE